MKRPSFTALPRPVITCIMSEKTPRENLALMKNGDYQGAQAFAIQMERMPNSELTDDNFRAFVNATAKPVMLIRYRGNNDLTDEERAEVLYRATACGAAAVDFTADMFDPSPREFSADPRAVDRQKRAIDRVHELGGEVVMSSHMTDEARTCEQVLEHLKAVEARGADYAKIVTRADTEEEFLEALKTTMALRREMKIPFIFLCGGRFAAPIRFIGPMLGNCLTFCVDRYTPDFITPQPPVENMLRVLKDVNWKLEDYIG